MNNSTGEFDPLLSTLRSLDPVKRVGRVVGVRGMLIHATGIGARIGEVCELHDPMSGQVRMAEVVGIERSMTVLMPLGSPQAVSAETEVISRSRPATVAVGPGLLGRCVDAMGHVMDGRESPTGLLRVQLHREPPNALIRTPISRAFHSGVRAIDNALKVGEGQRIGIFAPAGCNKRSLLRMLARASVDVNVVVLLGVPGHEVRESIEHHIGAEGLRKSVVVVATADRPALERVRAAYVGTAIAEYFRDQGQRALLLLDSVTRFSWAQRDVCLAVGEAPIRHGYPQSVLAALPALFERAGNNDKGSITAFYMMLPDEADPIGEEACNLLDGHLSLSPALAADSD